MPDDVNATGLVVLEKIPGAPAPESVYLIQEPGCLLENAV
jgi:hypothetical protein